MRSFSGGFSMRSNWKAKVSMNVAFFLFLFAWKVAQGKI